MVQTEVGRSETEGLMHYMWKQLVQVTSNPCRAIRL